MAVPDKKTAAISLSGLVGAGALFTAMDARYATASDIELLIDTIQEERIERMELCIDEAERQLKYILLTPESERDAIDVQVQMEINGIGLYSSFVHVDTRSGSLARW